ncbi:MAG: hypothetical protein ACRCYR_18540 [Phycicoccus sp.]
MASLDGTDLQPIDVGVASLAAAIAGFLEVAPQAAAAHGTALAVVGIGMQQAVASWRDASDRAADAYTQPIGRIVAGPQVYTR